jgi:hypothetical protein
MSPKKSNIFVFETKFIIEQKRSLSDLKIFGPKAIDLFSFQVRAGILGRQRPLLAAKTHIHVVRPG